MSAKNAKNTPSKPHKAQGKQQRSADASLLHIAHPVATRIQATPAQNSRAAPWSATDTARPFALLAFGLRTIRRVDDLKQAWRTMATAANLRLWRALRTAL